MVRILQPPKQRFLAKVIARGIACTFYARGQQGMARNSKTASYFEGLSDNSVIIVCTMIYHALIYYALTEYASGDKKTMKFEGKDVECEY